MKGEPLLDIQPVERPEAPRSRVSMPMALTIGLLSLTAVSAIALRTGGADGAVPPAATATQVGTDAAPSSTTSELAATGAEQVDPGPASDATIDPPAPTSDASVDPSASVGGPPIELTSLDGSRLQIPTGDPTVVYFMSTTGCVACEIGAFELQDLYVEGHQLDVIALEVIPDVPIEWMADYQHQLRLDYPVVADPDGAVGVRYDMAMLSMAIVLDASGRMVSGPFDPAAPSALDAAVATIDVQRNPQAETTDSQPIKLLP